MSVDFQLFVGELLFILIALVRVISEKSSHAVQHVEMVPLLGAKTLSVFFIYKLFQTHVHIVFDFSIFLSI